MGTGGDTDQQAKLGADWSDADRGAAEAEAVAGDGGAQGEEVVRPGVDSLPEATGTVDVAVTQVDYKVEGTGADEEPFVHVFGRTEDGTLEHVRVREFRPYFYAPTESVDDDDLAHERITDWEETDDDGEPYESIRGERLTKIFGQTPRDVGEVRDRFDHYEADILFPNRFLIDKDVRSGVRIPERRAADVEGLPAHVDDDTLVVHHSEVAAVDVHAPPRVHTLDIEVDDRRGFPEDGEEEILCLTAHDSRDDEYVTWLYVSPDLHEDAGVPDDLPDYDPIEGDGVALDVRSFESEAAMLADYLEYVERTDFDLAVGWNVDDFDAPYLIDRLERLDDRTDDYDLDPDRLSRIGEVWRSDWGGPDVKGRVVFDLLRGYRSMVRSELDSYRLDAVGEEELGVGKERYPGDIGDLWEDDPTRLLEYNLRDVEICVELDRKQEVVAFYQEVASFVGCKIEDAPTAGDAVDMYVLHKAHGEFALPSKGQVEEGEEFEGGAVFEPVTGIKEMVSVLDLKSLYPMAMRTINASPETKVDEDFDGPVYEAPNGTRFRKQPDGIMREMITELLDEREDKKAQRDDHEPGADAYELYDRQQQAVKVIMNCFTPDTDVLTPDGVRNVRDLAVGDEVYSLDPDSMEMEVKPVVETHAYPEYDGELVEMETDKIDFRVTPNHRMLVRKDERNGISWDEDDYRFVEAGDLDRATNYRLPHDWDGPDGERIERVDLTELLDEYEVWADNDVHGHTLAAELGWYPDKVQKADEDTTGYVFSAAEFEEHREYLDDACSTFYVHAEPNRKWIPRFYDGDDFLELLAWYVTEGNVYHSEDKQFGENFRGSATTVKIAQDERATDDDRALADGTERAVGDGGERARTDGGESDHAAIGALLDRMGFDYYVDEQCYQFTSRLLGRFLEATCGEDSFEKRIPDLVFEASQDQKRLFLDTLVAGDGDRQENSWRYSTASEQLRDDVLRLCAHLGLTANYRRDSGCWRIYVAEGSKNTLRMHRSGSRSTAEEGVYCVTVADNHTLLAGRNGKFQFVGQSLYGVSGWTRFRLYDKDAAAAVTATGREVIEFTEEVANRLDYHVTYGDTDSVMLELGGNVSADDAIEQSFELEERINDSYAEFAERLGADEHFFEIEFEKLYRRFFQAGKKKRYAGHIVWSEGKDVDDIDITGFEYKRSDIAPITKEVQQRVIEMIVRGEDLEDVKEYVHGVIEDFQSGRVDPEDVAIPGGIGKRLDNYDTDTAHVRGAKYANLLLGTNFQRGSKPKRLYLSKVHPDFFDRIEDERGLDTDDPVYREFKVAVEEGDGVICFEYADQVPAEFEVDWDKMLEKTLRGPIARILEALDVSWQEVRDGQEQTGLGSFG